MKGEKMNIPRIVKFDYNDHGTPYRQLIILDANKKLNDKDLIRLWLRKHYQLGYIRCDDESKSFGGYWDKIDVPKTTFGYKQCLEEPNKYYWNWQHLTSIDIKEVKPISAEEHQVLKDYVDVVTIPEKKFSKKLLTHCVF